MNSSNNNNYKNDNNNSNEEFIQVEGIIEKVLPQTQFLVKLDSGQEILAYISGKLKKHYIKIWKGDYVSLLVSPYDLKRGRIIRRKKINFIAANQKVSYKKSFYNKKKKFKK